MGFVWVLAVLVHVTAIALSPLQDLPFEVDGDLVLKADDDPGIVGPGLHGLRLEGDLTRGIKKRDLEARLLYEGDRVSLGVRIGDLDRLHVFEMGASGDDVRIDGIVFWHCYTNVVTRIPASVTVIFQISPPGVDFR